MMIKDIEAVSYTHLRAHETKANNDDKGYRREFIRLVEAAKGLERTNKN